MTTPRHARRAPAVPRADLARTALVGAVTIGAAVTVIALFATVGAVLGIEFKVFSKEAVETLGGKRYTGYFANLVVLVWQASAAAALLGALVLRRSGHREASGFLLATGALTAIMVFDDFFLFHESVYPKLGIPEEAVYVAYGLSTLALAWRFRERFGAALVLLFAAWGFWGASVVFDIIQESGGPHLHLLEDGAKAVGTALWSVMVIRVAATQLLSVVRAPADPRPADVPVG